MSKYYFLIIALCIVLIVFIWLLFRSVISNLDKEKLKGAGQQPVSRVTGSNYHLINIKS